MVPQSTEPAVAGADLYGGLDPRDLPAYTLADAARYLKLPATTVRQWVRGRTYPLADGQGSSDPLVITPKPGGDLSFTNLVELHVLRALRRRRVSMDRIRRALDHVERTLQASHPLATVQFMTDGIDLFVDELGHLVSASGHGQVAMREILVLHLRRIERDPQGLAARLFPFTRSSDEFDSPRAVVIDPRVSFGRPVLAGTGVPTRVLFERFQAGDDLSALAQDYDCDAVKVEEAIRCHQQLAA